MKINNITSEINNNMINHQNMGSSPARINKYDTLHSTNQGRNAHQDKLRIPENYESKRINLASNINRQERVYFEQMYPAHKNQIQAYLDQNQVSKPEKGQFVDLRR
ncbi:MAG: hypothetical protein KAR38_03055 [Calditrichia bacterium]|nr:hypothetical protein [Calditrichia bacterium]